jgi:hypothetical protein
MRGNGVVTELCLTFVYGWLLPSKRKAKQKTLSAHYQSVVLVWLFPAFLSDFYFIKTLNKVLFIVAFFAVAVSASAQFKLGVKAGFNASTIDGMKSNEYKVNYRPVFSVGVLAQCMMSEKFGLETGLYYTTLGANATEMLWYDENNDLEVDVKLSPSYLQLPVSLLYKFNVGQDLYLYPSLGLYVGYGIGGKIKVSGGVGDITVSEDTDYFGKSGGEEEWANRLDAGATIGLNLKFNKFLIGLGYELGLLKINKEKAEGDEKNWYNGNIKVSVGYLF